MKNLLLTVAFLTISISSYSGTIIAAGGGTTTGSTNPGEVQYVCCADGAGAYGVGCATGTGNCTLSGGGVVGGSCSCGDIVLDEQAPIKIQSVKTR